MTRLLSCIVCLTEQGWDPARPEETMNALILANPAETIRNGNALCKDHVYYPLKSHPNAPE